LTTQTDALRSTKATMDTDYGFPFKSTIEIPNSKSAKAILREIGNSE